MDAIVRKIKVRLGLKQSVKALSIRILFQPDTSHQLPYCSYEGSKHEFAAAICKHVLSGPSSAQNAELVLEQLDEIDPSVQESVFKKFNAEIERIDFNSLVVNNKMLHFTLR